MRIVFEKRRKKTKQRYLKKIIAVCLIMNIVITITALTICVLSRNVDGEILAAIIAPWCVEFALGAWVKTTETKRKDDDEQV